MVNVPNNKSCTVALPKACNYATYEVNQAVSATICETHSATDDLSALAERVLKRNQRNYQGNYPATNTLQSKEKLTTNFKQEEIKKLLKMIGLHYGANREEIEQELSDVLQNYSLEACLITYRKVAQSLRINN